jgi:hypothetical protein
MDLAGQPIADVFLYVIPVSFLKFMPQEGAPNDGGIFCG